MSLVALIVTAFFVRIYTSALSEPDVYDSGPNMLVNAIMIVIVLVLISLTSLTITIDEKYLRLKFGLGFLGRRFLLSDIRSATAVRNKWYYGWGIRFWLWPRMTIYNVAGLDAIEVVLRNGKIYRLGTNDPQGLETAIKKKLI